MGTLRYADSAENDLLDAWLHIAIDNPAAADRIVETVDREARLLLTHPDMGRTRPELAAGLRSWPTRTRYVPAQRRPRAVSRCRQSCSAPSSRRGVGRCRRSAGT